MLPRRCGCLIMDSLDAQLAALPTLSAAQLRTEWRRLYRAPPPPMTADLLRRGIAYRLQERVLGGLSPATRKEIEKLCKQLEKTGEAIALPSIRIKPGTRLVREWGGQTHHVIVLSDGFLYRDRQFRSLSQIATMIAGVRWSGPRFFGLKQRASRRGIADA